MNTAYLYEFLALADALNYTKAANALYVSQSVLSRHMQELEKELGVELLNRSTHSVALTEAGKLLAQDGPALLKNYESALNRLRTKHLSRQGRIRIGMGTEYSFSTHIRDFLLRFEKNYPNIELVYDVFPANTPSSIVCRYDIFFTPCVFHDLPSSARIKKTGSHGIYAVLPKGHPLMAQSSVYLHQLRGLTIIVPHADELFGPYAQNYLLAEKATKGQVSCIKVDNISTALFLVSMGKGICLAPRYAQNLISANNFFVSVSDRSCRFDEYIYLCSSDNPAAELMFREFCEPDSLI